MLEQLTENLAAVDAELPADVALTADAGYFSEANVDSDAEHDLDAYIATGRLKHDEPPDPEQPLPDHATVRLRPTGRLL
ncbi:hypothetical protein NBH00_08565 [Paraconexibacter antarcticus]|uniref:DDE family transposase n=1 Tax=Paraconexibacter antarcticus TaxID=2949664 RepID=A0ABY5DW45_9ACTN|nr:hypothetical protein [Paraconexibacter antarcticus]UTI66246.1 hypothetical protein NBH00_08565 [Paraconexibacter antarcticus]